MALETTSYIGGLVATNPTATDPKSAGDDHLRLIKNALLNSFAGFSGLVVSTGTEAQGSTVNDYTVTLSPAPAAYTSGMVVLFKATHANTSAATLQVNALGTKSLVDVSGSALVSGIIANGALCAAYYDGTSFYLVSANGRLAAPTPTGGDNSTRIATTAYVQGEIATKANLASPALTGTPTAPTATGGTNTTQIATTAYVQGELGTKANLASPALTGTPTAPTATAGTNTTQIATTAFVIAQAFSAALPSQTGNAGKFVVTDGTNASWGNTLSAPTVNGYTEGVVTANTGTAYTIDISAAGVQILTLTGNCTFTFPTATAGKSFLLLLKQDGTGSRTVTFPAAVKWPGSTTPTLTSTASKGDKIVFTADGTYWWGSVAGLNYL